ncbi:unnamed protein product [Urochloa humidicola]
MDIATLRLIIDVALAIEKAADNAKQNIRDCKNIKSRVVRVTKNLRRLENNQQLLKDSAVSPTVEALGDILREAQVLVEDCMVKRNVISLLCTAGKLSKKLRRMDKSISASIIDLMCAMMGLQESQSSQQSDHPPVHDHEPVRVRSSAPDDEMNNPPSRSSTVHEIVDIADQIKAVTKMVRKNKEECFEINKRAGQLSAFLPRLENTDIIKDPALSADLEKLVETLHHALELVTACQGRTLLACEGGNGPTDEELSQQLHDVLDQIVLELDDMTEISIRYSIGPTSSSVSVIIMASCFVAKLLRVGRQRSKRISLQSTGQTSQLNTSIKADPEEIEAVASEPISVASSANPLHDDPSLLQGGTGTTTDTEAPGPSSSKV